MADQWTLHQAAAQGNLEKVRQLLDDGESVDKPNEIPEASSHQEEYPPRRWCRQVTWYETWDDIDQDGWSPLHMAAYYGKEEVVRLLLARGADIDKTYHGGSTVFHAAAAGGALEVVRLLIE